LEISFWASEKDLEKRQFENFKDFILIDYFDGALSILSFLGLASMIFIWGLWMMVNYYQGQFAE